MIFFSTNANANIRFNAKSHKPTVTARRTSVTLPLTQFVNDIASIDCVMQRLRATQEIRQEISAYLFFAYFRNNRATMVHLAKLLYSIPPRIRLEGKQLNILSKNCFFPHQRFFEFIGENCRSLYFPPKTRLFHAGDLFLGYFIIKKVLLHSLCWKCYMTFTYIF